MGKVYSVVKAHWPDSVVNVNSNRILEKRKRAHECHDQDELHSTPKRRRMEATMKFIYQALFIEGKDSDVTVSVLGKEWHLHKMYLQQSPYFGSMFSGQWSESGKSEIAIEVDDPNINEECINVVFSSCYTDELLVNPSMVVGVLAASTLFLMEGLIEQCTEIMLENISPVTAVKYYSAATDYGIQKVKDEVVRWLAVNLVTYYYENLNQLQDIDPDLMELVLKHPDLCVIQTETYLYLVLKTWICIRSVPSWQVGPDIHKTCDDFFRKQNKDLAFIEREEGKEFARVFKWLRVGHLVKHIDDATLVVKDNILPVSWLKDASWNHWTSFLKIVSANDPGPEGVGEDFFNNHCIRLGRVISSGDCQSWKWNCFSFGVELVWTITRHLATVQRVRGLMETRNPSSSRKIIARISVLNLNDKRQIVRKETSPMRDLSLMRNQEVKLLEMGTCLEYPMYVQVHLLLLSPQESSNSD